MEQNLNQAENSLKNLQNILEDIVDHIKMEEVLSMLEEICYEKAAHLRTNWQDEPVAREWEEIGAILLQAKVKAFGPVPRKSIGRLESVLDKDIEREG